jgi:hypothetical protein
VYIVHDHVHAAQVVGGFIPDRKALTSYFGYTVAKNLNHIVGRTHPFSFVLPYGYFNCAKMLLTCINACATGKLTY